MKSCRKTIGIAAALLSIAVICVTFFQVTSAKASDKLVIRLAHNQAAGSEIADSIALISDIVAEDASMNMEVQIYPSGVLGTEKDIIEMVKAGILDMAKVSSNTLGQFKEEYSIFAVPYLFNGQQHYYDAMQKSEKVKELFMSTEDEGYIAIGYYANGARNFYLKEDKPCVEPSALKGKKIRSMPNTTSMDMIEAMGGTPVPMAAGESFTAAGNCGRSGEYGAGPYRGRPSGFGEVLYIYRAPVLPGHLHYQHQDLEPHDQGTAGLPGKGL